MSRTCRWVLRVGTLGAVMILLTVGSAGNASQRTRCKGPVEGLSLNCIPPRTR